MANKIIVYSCLSDKIREAIDEGRSFTVMGEIVMFKSAIVTLRKLGFNVRIVSSTEEFMKEDTRGTVYYILDYLTLPQVKDIVLAQDKVHRIRFFCYWGRTLEEIPWHGLQPHQICIPFPYHNKPNTFLGFIMPDLATTGTLTGLQPAIRGYLWGKEAKYYNRGIVDELGKAGIQFYATCVDDIRSYTNVVNVGLQSRENYLSLIKHMDYVIGFGDPIAGPTIVETLELGKILIAPRRQIPNFLHAHPNIVLLDDLTTESLVNVIRDIEAGHKYSSMAGVPEYHEEQYTERIKGIFPPLPSRRTCIIRSEMRDSNIFHFLVFEIKAIWDFISRNNKVDYHVILNNYMNTDATHRWRRAVLEGFCTRVYVQGDTMSAVVFDNALMDFKINYSTIRPMIESAKFIDYEPNASLIEMVRRIKTTRLGDGWEADIPSGLLLIQRRGTRALYNSKSQGLLEDTLKDACNQANIPFRCCYFEGITFDEQLRAVHEAKWIVAAHGAAETNIIFANRGAHILEVNMRPHWYCDPVCDKHFSGEIPFEKKCKEKLTYYPIFHKADYHNLAKSCGLKYSEIEPTGYGGRFMDRNPISKERMYVSVEDVMRHTQSST